MVIFIMWFSVILAYCAVVVRISKVRSTVSCCNSHCLLHQFLFYVIFRWRQRLILQLLVLTLIAYSVVVVWDSNMWSMEADNHGISLLDQCLFSVVLFLRQSRFSLQVSLIILIAYCIIVVRVRDVRSALSGSAHFKWVSFLCIFDTGSVQSTVLLLITLIISL